MKKIILLTIAALLFAVTSVFAKNTINTKKQVVEFQLPYAGILPDSPLYGLKTFRDRLISFFISDPIKKAEFDLLESDKRLSGAVALFAQGPKKYDLTESTISKGENYFEDAIKNLKTARKEGRTIEQNLLGNMDLSSRKHKEILQDMISKTTGDLQKRFSKDLERMDSLESKFVKLGPNKSKSTANRIIFLL